MKFNDLTLGQKFTTDSKPKLVLRKAKYKKGTCCTPEHNAIDLAGKKHLIDGYATVKLVEN